MGGGRERNRREKMERKRKRGIGKRWHREKMKRKMEGGDWVKGESEGKGARNRVH